MKATHIFMLAAMLIMAMASGCASHKTAIGFAEDEAQVAKVKAQVEQQKEERQQTKLEDEKAKTPDWALTPPRPDATGMYAVGSADSNSLRLSIAQARLRAEFGLAKLYKKELSGSERDFQRDSGGDEIRVRYQSLIDELVSASIVGEETIKQETQPIHGRVYAWVLMKLPYDEFNKVLKGQRMQTRDKAIQSAFDDLERRLDKRRKQGIENAQIQHNMKMDEMQKRNDILMKNQKSAEIKTAVKPEQSQKGRSQGKPETHQSKIAILQPGGDGQ